jgi:serine phosphatase RsbU (regulator of sigma subunit)
VDDVELFVQNPKIPDGISVSASARPVQSAEGELIGGVVVFRDITEHRRAEADRAKRLEAEREIAIARTVQEGLFPKDFPSPAGFDIAGAVFTADTASGDYFDFIPMREDSLGIVVADVCGHGLGPAMMMVQTQAYLRALARTESDPGQILTGVNQLLRPQADTGRFVSLFLGRLDPRTRSFTFASAGHSGYLLKHSGDLTTLDATGMVLGLLQNARIVGAPAISLESGDVIYLPTDGIFESLAPDRTLFGIRRMHDVVCENRDRSANEIVDALYRAARDWAQGRPQDDDISVVVIKVQ